MVSLLELRYGPHDNDWIISADVIALWYVAFKNEFTWENGASDRLLRLFMKLIDEKCPEYEVVDHVFSHLLRAAAYFRRKTGCTDLDEMSAGLSESYSILGINMAEARIAGEEVELDIVVKRG